MKKDAEKKPWFYFHIIYMFLCNFIDNFFAAFPIIYVLQV